jgi:small subunit ribosomal protein S16
MLIIRLQRTGRKHEPTFRVVLTDSKNGPKSGKYLKNLGWYDSRLKNDAAKQLDVEAIKHWISKGAQLSLTLHNFLISQKVITGKKLNALPKKTPQKKAEEAKKEEVKPAAEAAPVAEAKVEAAAPAEVSTPATPPVETPTAA